MCHWQRGDYPLMQITVCIGDRFLSRFHQPMALPPQLEELSLLQYLGRSFWGIGGGVGIAHQLASEQTLGLRVNFGYFTPWGEQSQAGRISLALWYALGT